jgi:hypothetical protein
MKNMPFVKNPIYAKFYSCYMVLMVSNHIYVLIFITCPCTTYTHTQIYIYIISPSPKTVEYQVFGWFLKFLELLRQFSPGPDMSDF